MKPLNNTLYRLLEQRFGKVRISNEGQAMVGRYEKDFVRGGEVWVMQNPGEYYQVCCPFCREGRFRLYINHRWGARDEKGFRNLWLAICYNTSGVCTSPENREKLFEELNQIGDVERPKIRQGEVVTESPISELPGPCTPLHLLDPAHPANAYLAGRYYNPEHLGRFYRVNYCSDSMFMLARNRIVAPIYMGGILRGWQCRYIGDLNWKDKTKDNPPKWWSDPQMKRNMLLYNLDNAKRYRTGVVVEGPGDVWSFGPMAMATLGSSMSAYQAKLLRNFREYGVVLLWDPDVKADPVKMRHVTEKTLPMLRENVGDKGKIAVVWLPEGKDPGDLDRAYMRDYVAEAAAKEGLTVDWRLR